MRIRTWCLAAAVICAPVSRLIAQSQSAAVGYLALVSTPTAGVTPVAKQWMLADPAPGIGIETQWGHVSANGGSINTFTAGVTMPLAAGHADVGISGGYLKPSCDAGSCSGYAVASAVVEGRVLQTHTNAATFTVGLSGRVGFAKPSDATVWSAAASLPLSLAMGSPKGVQFVPFVSPGFGWGHMSSGSDSQSGTRFMLGGGVGVMSATSGIGSTVGAQKVLIQGGKIVFGAGLTWSRR